MSMEGDRMLEGDVGMADEDGVMVDLPWSPYRHGSPPQIVQQHFSIQQQQQQPAPYRHFHHPPIHPYINTQPTTNPIANSTLTMAARHTFPIRPFPPTCRLALCTRRRLTILRASFVDGHPEHRAIGSSSKWH